MTTAISLFDLANLSIGTPEIGAVNFNALHTLLHAILKNLNIQYVNVEIREEDREFFKPPPSLYLQKSTLETEKDIKEASPYHQMEKKLIEIERQIDALNKLPSSAELLKMSSGLEQTSPVNDMWKFMQMRRKMDANEEGISKAMNLLQDLLNEISALHKSRESLEGKIKTIKEFLDSLDVKGLLSRLSALEKYRDQLTSFEKLLHLVQDRLGLYPNPEDLDNMVSWDILQDALLAGKKNKMRVSPHQQLSNNVHTGVQLSGHLHQLSPPLGKSDSQSDHLPQATAQANQPVDQKDQLLQPGAQPGQQDQLVGESQQSGTNQDQTFQNGIEPSHTSQPNQQYPIPDPDQMTPPTFVMSTSQGQQPASVTPESASVPPQQITSKSPGFSSVSRPTSSRSSSVAARYADTVDALREIGQLTDQHKALTERVIQLEVTMPTKADIADLDKLKALIATMANKNIPDNLPAELAHLKQLMKELAEGNHKDEKLLDYIQNAVLQLQNEYKKLNSITDNLIDDHQKKQKDINNLFQSVEHLNEKKADKEHIEMEIDVKADKRALEGKVSRTYFDTTTEQLNQMMQEMLQKITGQEEDWQKVLDKLSKEMESKLDRIELDPLKKQLEDRWKNIRKQLQERPPLYEAGDAAGIRKQLVARFHCISCSRPVDMLVPGPHIVTVPNVSGFNSQKSMRPYIVYDLEQVRQHTRSLSDRIPEMADYSYLNSARSCGGSHTLTNPHRRYNKLQQVAQYLQDEDELPAPVIIKHEEIDILGVDGQIYKGRVNTRLPLIQDKEVLPPKTKVNPSNSSICKSTSLDPDSPPARPQSAKVSPRSRPVSARYRKERPVSSQGRIMLSHSNTVPNALQTSKQETESDGQEILQIQMDIPLGQLHDGSPATSV
ncbi:uncharacterized protein C16orf96 homolog [Protopterus annectens]|uniref:uncharacterized protein C16orf96 homolog n=1 Tax=Protopterus annectens TaxID=7888 RepID=UPI001CF933B0|nr:uncharacterized protein C16orf96 homolog [Protopterus annectens]